MKQFFRYVLQQQIIDFFHADGKGTDLKEMYHLAEYQLLTMDLKSRGISSQNLIKIYYYQVTFQKLKLIVC